jgi:hypothetical protein
MVIVQVISCFLIVIENITTFSGINLQFLLIIFDSVGLLLKRVIAFHYSNELL